MVLQGQWKQISRYYVPTRTPTQVASHAQKHFLRISGNTKRRSKFAVVDALALSMQKEGGEDVSLGDRVPSRPGPSSRADGAEGRQRTLSRFANSGRANSGGTMSDSFEQGMQFGRSVVSIPPVQADGVAVGIPLPELPQLTPFDGNTKIPMLKVLPGRIRASSTVCRPPSPSPSQRKKGDADDEVHDGESRPLYAHEKSRRKKRTRFRDGDMYSSGLDALAGVAVAMALHEETGGARNE